MQLLHLVGFISLLSMMHGTTNIKLQILVMDYGFGEPRFLFELKIKLPFCCMAIYIYIYIFFFFNKIHTSTCAFIIFETQVTDFNHCTEHHFGIAFLEAYALIILSHYEFL